MRAEPNYRLDRYRLRGSGLFPETRSGASYGAFEVRLPSGVTLFVISSGLSDRESESHLPDDCRGFEHVSVSHRDRCPTWEEMEFVRDLFWGPEETVIQIHPPKSRKVNHHKTCLHLWRDTTRDVRVPGAELLGPLERVS